MYIKKVTAPKTWYKFNSQKYITSVKPGKPLYLSYPLVLVCKQITKNNSSIFNKKLIKQKLIKVNNKVIKQANFPVMLLDLIQYQDKIYRLLFNNTKLIIKSTNSSRLYLSVNKFNKFKNNKFQITLNNGFTYLSENKPDYQFLEYNINDSKYNPLYLSEKDNVLIIKGKYLGKFSEIVSYTKDIVNLKIENSFVKLSIKQIIKIKDL
jgi:ribosomal protein S4E